MKQQELKAKEIKFIDIKFKPSWYVVPVRRVK